MKLARPLVATLAALLCTAVTAAGNHAAGHDGDDQGQAIGKPGVAARASRTVKIDMTDAMRFTPATIRVTQGETVRFVVSNSGQLKHELVLGTPAELKEHYAMMMKMPGMEHADDNMVAVAPGRTGEMVWQFTRAGTIDFACLQPGHYDAGMKGAVEVAAAKGGAAKGEAAKPTGSGHHGH